MGSSEMLDGLEVLREQFDLKEIMRLIEYTSRWVSIETFHYLPVWYPEEARQDSQYKKDWITPQYNTNKETGEKVHRKIGNTNAGKALTMALGMDNRPNWTCCHIWGIDDSSYQKTNKVVKDKRYYSCVANMVLLPTPLKAFTDVMPEVKTMLRVASAAYYKWAPDHDDLPDLQQMKVDCEGFKRESVFPKTWSIESTDKKMKGVQNFSPKIKARADRRMKKINQEIVNAAGTKYPIGEVNNVLQYWRGQLNAGV